MDSNLIPTYPNSSINPIFPKGDIYSEFLNNNNDNFLLDNASISSNLEPFDTFFIGKHSRNSSYEENNYVNKITPSFKSNNNTPNSGMQFHFNKTDCDNFLYPNGNQSMPILSTNKTKNNKTKKGNNKKENDEKKSYKKKQKKLFNSFLPNKMNEAQKQNQKIKNKISARKSRLKKKLYVEQLEKKYFLVNKELNEIKQKLNMDMSPNIIIPLKEFEEGEATSSKSSKIFNYDIFNVDELKEEEKIIINEKNNEKKDINRYNSFTTKQRLILEQLLIEQIEIMMPIRIRMFQNKYLKLLNIDKNDNIGIIKNKVKENLKAIEEVYGINNVIIESNGGEKPQLHQYDINNNKSMAYQIYNYYYNLGNYINEFEKIYFSLI
jgi:hypothetical protein